MCSLKPLKLNDLPLEKGLRMRCHLLSVLGIGSNKVHGLAAFALLAGCAAAAPASIVDLVNNTSGSANGALFYRAGFQPAGTGVLNPFVRVQHDNGPSNNGHSRNGEEQGYNTSGRPVQYDEHTDQYTHDLLFSAIPIVVISSTSYLEFSLDINEPNGQQALLSLDQVHIYTSATGGQNGLESTLGTLRYALGAFLNDNTVTMDYDLSSGSGQGDMKMYIPLANFAGVGANDFVYLYSHFGSLGDDWETGDGFEEWAVGTPVPAPGVLALMALAGLSGRRRRTA
jgi:hypothetical protein